MPAIRANAPLSAVILALSCASASAAVVEESIGVTFPDRIGAMVFHGRKAFDDPRLGDVIRYDEAGRDLPAGGLTVGVYVYNGGLAHISDDLDSRQVRLNFRQVITEVKTMEQLGKAKAVRLPPEGEQVTALAGCGPQFVWERYEMELPEGATLTSATYLTVMHDNFVKLRISYRKGDAKSPAIAEDFVARLHNVLGGCAP